jgi:predicted choloylglycine hydrolase
MNKKEKHYLTRLIEKVERACICWRTNQSLMKAEDWRELEGLVSEYKTTILKVDIDEIGLVSEYKTTILLERWI